MRAIRSGLIGGTLLLVAMFALSVSAGGWAVATLDAMPTFVAGQETTVGFTLRQHGNTLIGNMNPSEIVFRNVASGQRLAFPAPDAGPQGHYAARVTLPEPGAWAWTINSFGQHPMPTLNVVPSGASPVAAGMNSTPVARWATYPAIAVLAILAVGGLILGLRWRISPIRSIHRTELREPQPVI